MANYRVANERPRLGRMFEHRKMSGAAFEVKERQNPTPIEADIKKIIAEFAQLQEEHFEADYNVGGARSCVHRRQPDFGAGRRCVHHLAQDS